MPKQKYEIAAEVVAGTTWEGNDPDMVALSFSETFFDRAQAAHDFMASTPGFGQILAEDVFKAKGQYIFATDEGAPVVEVDGEEYQRMKGGYKFDRGDAWVFADGRVEAWLRVEESEERIACDLGNISDLRSRCTPVINKKLRMGM